MCKKFFVNINTLNYHQLKYHSDTSHLTTDELLNNFNLSVCVSNNTITAEQDLNQSIFNNGFSSKLIKSNEGDAQFRTFESECSNYLNKYDKNFSIGLLNINSIESKFHDVAFILKKQLLDILVINETKLTDKTDSTLFESINYDLIRRDRLKNKGGGIIVFIKKNLNRSNLKIDQESSNEIISLLELLYKDQAH
jgi:hypothetical protein